MKHRFEKNSKYFTICVYAFITVVLCIIVSAAIEHWGSITEVIGKVMEAVSPFIIGMFIAYLINPLAKFLNIKVLKPICKSKFKKFRNVASVLVSYVIVIGVVSTIMFYIIPQIMDTLKQIGSFVNSAQNGFTKVMNMIEAFEDKHPSIDLSPIEKIVEDVPKQIAEVFSSSIPVIISKVYDTSMSLVSGILDFVIAVIVSIYMLLDKSRLINSSKKIIYAMLGERNGDIFIKESGKCNEIFGNFIVGKTIDSLIIGILCFFLMKVTGLPYALIISIIVGVTNMIPYFGPFIGAIPGILLLLMVDFSYGLVFGIMIFALQQFDGLYLGPTILGESTGIRPLWIIFAITVGGFVAGPLGMFLGVPTVAVLAYLFEKLFDKRLKKKKIEFITDEETGIITRKVELIETKKEIVVVKKSEQAQNNSIKDKNEN